MPIKQSWLWRLDGQSIGVSNPVNSLRIKEEVVEPNNSRKEAYALAFGSPVDENIGEIGDEDDWYCVSFEENGTFWISVSNLGLEKVVNSNFKEVLCVDSLDDQVIGKASGSYYGCFTPRDKERKSNKLAVFRGQRIYIRVSALEHNIARYGLEAIFRPRQDFVLTEREENDTKNRAMDMPLNTRVRSSIGYDEDQSDWYKVRFPSAGIFYFTVRNHMDSDIGNGCFHKARCVDGEVDFVRSIAAGTYYGSFMPGDENDSDALVVEEGEVLFLHVKSLVKNRAYYSIEANFTPAKK